MRIENRIELQVYSMLLAGYNKNYNKFDENERGKMYHILMLKSLYI